MPGSAQPQRESECLCREHSGDGDPYDSGELVQADLFFRRHIQNVPETAVHLPESVAARPVGWVGVGVRDIATENYVEKEMADVVNPSSGRQGK